MLPATFSPLKDVVVMNLTYHASNTKEVRAAYSLAKYGEDPGLRSGC